MTFKSRRRHAILFTKDECAPCFKTKVFVATLLGGRPELGEVFSQMQKEYHSALVEAYSLELYPTLLIVDQNIKGDQTDEVERFVGGKLVREVLEEKLTEIYKERQL